MKDLIERQAAIDSINKYKVEHGFDYYDCACLIEQDIAELPSAQPEPRIGEWVAVWDANGVSSEAVCNICGRISTRPAGKFCKWCGAKMNGGDQKDA